MFRTNQTRSIDPTRQPAKIAIVEDHVMFADLLQHVCEREFGAHVVVRESHGRPALSAIRANAPHLVLLDLGLPDVDGLAVAKVVLEERPQTRILILSALSDPCTLNRVRNVPVHGFVDKMTQNVEILKSAVDAVLNRGSFLTI